MKNLIKILLYSLLVLLVVAISVMIYKRSNTPDPEAQLAEVDEIDRILADTLDINSSNFSSEDSAIFSMTGQVSDVVGKPTEINPASTSQKAENSAPSSNLDKPISQTVANKIEASSHEVSLPKMNNTGNTHSTATKAATTTKAADVKASTTKATAVKTNTVVTKKAEVKATSKTAAIKTTKIETKVETSSNSGKFYVIAGSYIIPSGADAQVSKLKKLGYATAVKKSFPNDEYYRAVAGKYESRAQADKTVKALKAIGVAAFVKS